MFFQLNPHNEFILLTMTTECVFGMMTEIEKRDNLFKFCLKVTVVRFKSLYLKFVFINFIKYSVTTLWVPWLFCGIDDDSFFVAGRTRFICFHLTTYASDRKICGFKSLCINSRSLESEHHNSAAVYSLMTSLAPQALSRHQHCQVNHWVGEGIKENLSRFSIKAINKDFSWLYDSQLLH